MRLRGLAAVLACAAFAVWAQPALAAAPTSYSDLARDARGGAPEVTTVVVSNDDTGAVRFRINVANQERLATDSTLELFMDTDRNPGTGDPQALGAEYRVLIDGAAQTYDFAAWDGTRYDTSAPSDTIRVWYWSGASISINRSELGGASTIAFWVRAGGPNGTLDSAPDQGTWTYELGVGGTNPRDITAIAARTRPGSPRAGATWQLQVHALRLEETPGTVRPDRWGCAATLAGKRLRGSGPGGCTFRLPRSARGKRLVVTLTVAYMGEVVSGSASFRVR